MKKNLKKKIIGEWVWKQTYQLPEVFSSFKISGDPEGELTIRWAKGDSISFTGSENREVKDGDGLRNVHVSECHIFSSDHTFVRSSIWKSLDGNKGLASVLTTFRMIDDNLIKFNKFGYTAFIDAGLFQVQSYEQLVPYKFECDYVRKK